MIKKLGRLFHTLKHLKPTQLAFFVIRRKFPAAHIVFEGAPDCREDFRCLSSPLSIAGLGEGAHRFRFLNVEKELGDRIDWSPADVPRLWRYNLHYFDYLRDLSRSDVDKASLLLQWVDGNPQGSQPGWEPFTASLRIVNWIFYLAHNADAATPAIVKSLYTQALWLEKNDERHILANHYFENLKALAFAGAFFDGVDAERWRRKATKGLLEQLEEQTLADGGHYERTPQYHGLMLENYLDLLNLCGSNSALFPQSLVESCREKSFSGLRFLQHIVFPDQSIPLFNDSAFGISPSLTELADYYHRLTGESGLNDHADAVIDLPPSGLFGYRHNQSMVIFDAGDIGPSYQPGHTHCDMLSYELMWGGERIVVDSGVCEYEPGAMRQYVRSTRAHNTVSVDGADQSEVWGEFRVARRARITQGEISARGDSVEFCGAYRGFPATGGSVVHQRRGQLRLDSDGDFAALKITDHIEGTGEHLVESFVHLHPDLEAEEIDKDGLLITTAGGQQFELSFPKGVNYYREQGFYCPEFGVRIPNIRIVLSVEQRLPAHLVYSITKIN